MISAASVETLRLHIPTAFEENRGQSPASFRFIVSDRNIGIACDGLYDPPPVEFNGTGTTPIPLQFAGARASCGAELVNPDGSWVHYYRGADPQSHILNVPRHRTVQLTEVWPGVNIRLDATSSGMTMTFAATRAELLNSVRLRTPNPLRLQVVEGALQWSTIRWTLPPGFQVDVRDGEASFRSLSALPPGPVNLTLRADFIDLSLIPAAVDRDGNWYAHGATTAFAAVDGSAPMCYLGTAFQHCPDVSLTAFDVHANFRYQVYLLGSRSDNSHSIRVDEGGNVYIAGTTYSDDFPTTPGVLQPRYGGPASMEPFLRYLPGAMYL